MEFSRQEYWSVLPPGELLDSGIEPRSLASPALVEDSLPLLHPGSSNIRVLLLSSYSLNNEQTFCQEGAPVRQSPTLWKDDACRDEGGEENPGLPAASQRTAKGYCSCGLPGDTEVGLRVAVLTGRLKRNLWSMSQAYQVEAGVPGSFPASLGDTRRQCWPYYWWAGHRPHDGVWAGAARKPKWSHVQVPALQLTLRTKCRQPLIQEHHGTMAGYTETGELPNSHIHSSSPPQRWPESQLTGTGHMLSQLLCSRPLGLHRSSLAEPRKAVFSSRAVLLKPVHEGPVFPYFQMVAYRYLDKMQLKIPQECPSTVRISNLLLSLPVCASRCKHRSTNHP